MEDSDQPRWIFFLIKGRFSLESGGDNSVRARMELAAVHVAEASAPGTVASWVDCCRKSTEIKLNYI